MQPEHKWTVKRKKVPYLLKGMGFFVTLQTNDAKRI